jgi:hypothetical protein
MGDAKEALAASFIENEIDLSNTLLDVADLEVDHPEARVSATEKAQVGYRTALQWIGKLKDRGEFDRLTLRLARLKERLDL